MQRLYYQFPGTWFGDCMPFGKGDTFYLFHQRDTRRPGPFGEPFGWDLAVTRDFVHYEDRGVAIPRGTDEEQDQFIFAGSVFEAQGLYHSFYTGYNRDYPAQGKPAQVLMHAVSTDLLHWEKTQDKLTFAPPAGLRPRRLAGPLCGVGPGEGGVPADLRRPAPGPQDTADRPDGEVHLQGSEGLEV